MKNSVGLRHLKNKPNDPARNRNYKNKSKRNLSQLDYERNEKDCTNSENKINARKKSK